MAKQARQAKLVLEDGAEFTGWSFGRARSQAGEVVFTTGMTGYPQSLTDPSYRGQILVLTYPLAGNYGVSAGAAGEALLDAQGIPLHFESDRIQAAGFVVAEACYEPSHYSAALSLPVWLDRNNVPGVFGIDTRALTERLRERGVMRGKILVEGTRDVTFDSGMITHPVPDVSPAEVRVFRPENSGADAVLPRIVLVDCGAKANIFRCLLARNVEIVRVPWNYDVAGIEYDGVFLSNGPGDPKDCGRTIAAVRRVFQAEKPVFGICLGNQIMALAAGADTYKLPYGHRGQNQPCVETGTKRCYITSQNHGYAVREETLPSGWESWFINGNDGTVEGIRSTRHPFQAVQFHPEGCPGPRDTEFLVDRFIDQVKSRKSKT
ncbi:MAG: glutamine-hydrolyzing carbamoyl-phosphate synthase small subunit [Spirochaetaceae bacterium]|jgi:carbamoyl-phosphate synthase small subunit|nr:glutamine-hydrolyzing carbamoyl-phosphate synthase small subunit [Spirochaetaceae bacterium]